MTIPISDSPDPTNEPSLLVQSQARGLLQKLYGFDPEQDLLTIVRLADSSALPLDIEQYKSAEAFIAQVERVASVVSLKELKQKRVELAREIFGSFLFNLQTQGKLPHWIACFLDGRTLEPGFEQEWERRVKAEP